MVNIKESFQDEGGNTYLLFEDGTASILPPNNSSLVPNPKDIAQVVFKELLGNQFVYCEEIRRVKHPVFDDIQNYHFAVQTKETVINAMLPMKALSYEIEATDREFKRTKRITNEEIIKAYEGVFELLLDRPVKVLIQNRREHPVFNVQLVYCLIQFGKTSLNAIVPLNPSLLLDIEFEQPEEPKQEIEDIVKFVPLSVAPELPSEPIDQHQKKPRKRKKKKVEKD